jgi:hypothetical protein
VLHHVAKETTILACKAAFIAIRRGELQLSATAEMLTSDQKVAGSSPPDAPAFFRKVRVS